MSSRGNNVCNDSVYRTHKCTGLRKEGCHEGSMRVREMNNGSTVVVAVICLND